MEDDQYMEGNQRWGRNSAATVKSKADENVAKDMVKVEIMEILS